MQMNTLMNGDIVGLTQHMFGALSWRLWKNRREVLVCSIVLLSLYNYLMRGSVERITGNSRLPDRHRHSLLKSKMLIPSYIEEPQFFIEVGTSTLSPELEETTFEELENKVHNIRFFKIHKCSSTTVQTMFIRFAETHGLSLALPRGDVFVRNVVSEIPRAARTPNNIYNMLVHHAALNVQLESQLLHPTTIYITMLRDPVDRFISQYMWFRKTPNNIDTIGDVGIDEYILNVLQPRMKNKTFYEELNFMLTYLGYFQKFQSLEIPQEAFEEWDRIFDFVMITEYFDESLVFLKERLHWDEEEVVTFEINRRIKEDNDTLMSHRAAELLHEWTRGDRQLYLYYRQKLEQKIKDYGENRMKENVDNLRLVRETWKSLCIKKSGGNLDIGGLRRHKHSRRNDSVVHEITQEGLHYPLCVRALTTEYNYKVLMTLKQARLIQEGYMFPY